MTSGKQSKKHQVKSKSRETRRKSLNVVSRKSSLPFSICLRHLISKKKGYLYAFCCFHPSEKEKLHQKKLHAEKKIVREKIDTQTFLAFHKTPLKNAMSCWSCRNSLPCRYETPSMQTRVATPSFSDPHFLLKFSIHIPPKLTDQKETAKKII
jgi:hypothetical protein